MSETTSRKATGPLIRSACNSLMTTAKCGKPRGISHWEPSVGDRADVDRAPPLAVACHLARCRMRHASGYRSCSWLIR